jgi:hypothetical protein
MVNISRTMAQADRARVMTTVFLLVHFSINSSPASGSNVLMLLQPETCHPQRGPSKGVAYPGSRVPAYGTQPRKEAQDHQLQLSEHPETHQSHLMRTIKNHPRKAEIFSPGSHTKRASRASRNLNGRFHGHVPGGCIPSYGHLKILNDEKWWTQPWDSQSGWYNWGVPAFSPAWRHLSLSWHSNGMLDIETLVSCISCGFLAILCDLIFSATSVPNSSSQRIGHTGHTQW